METQKKSVFEVLNTIDCSAHTKKIKAGYKELTYLSWSWAWQYVKENYPTASYTIYEDARGCNYFTDGRTCWVKTGVTIEGLEHIEYLPVMDNSNNSLPIEKVTSRDVNDTIQRSLTKACARHGLGLYIYAGEDLPLDTDADQAKAASKPVTKQATKKTPEQATHQLSEEEADHIIKMIYSCKNREEVLQLYNTYPEYRKHQRVDAAFKAASNMYPASKGGQS